MIPASVLEAFEGEEQRTCLEVNTVAPARTIMNSSAEACCMMQFNEHSL
jgi:hypothetical protein